MMSPEPRYLNFALIASRMVIRCNALKKMGRRGTESNCRARMQSFCRSGRHLRFFFVGYRQGILVNQVCIILLSAQRKGNYWNEIVSRSHWKQPVAAYNFFWNGVVERH